MPTLHTWMCDDRDLWCIAKHLKRRWDYLGTITENLYNSQQFWNIKRATKTVTFARSDTESHIVKCPDFDVWKRGVLVIYAKFPKKVLLSCHKSCRVLDRVRVGLQILHVPTGYALTKSPKNAEGGFGFAIFFLDATTIRCNFWCSKNARTMETVGGELPNNCTGHF